jgi:hypothetical protein
MHPQLHAIAEEFQSATVRLRALAETVPATEWPRRPAPGRWSVAECVAHLNLTSNAYIPLLRDGIARARALNAGARRRYRRGFIGWLLWKGMGPPVRTRLKTIGPFIPEAASDATVLVGEFLRLQGEQIACLEQSDGLPIDRVRVASAFNPRVSYNVYSAFAIIARHQHRHLWQAEQGWRLLSTTPGACATR